MRNTVKILIIDDHPIVYEGMKQLIEKEPKFSVCEMAGSVDEGLEQLDNSKPDLVIVDLALKGRNGLEFIKTAVLKFPELPMLVISFFDEEVYAERVLRAGAKGYIMKSEATDNVIKAINVLLKGDYYLSEKIRRLFMQSLFMPSAAGETEVSKLSDRELEVFELIGKGSSTREIAEILQLSVKTVETYRSHIKHKFGIDTATKLIQFASQYYYARSLGRETVE